MAYLDLAFSRNCSRCQLDVGAARFRHDDDDDQLDVTSLAACGPLSFLHSFIPPTVHSPWVFNENQSALQSQET